MSTEFDAFNPNMKEWSEFFHKNGFIIIKNALTESQIKAVCDDLHFCENASKKKDKNKHAVHRRFFEKSNATVDLVQDSILYDFAQYMIKDICDEYEPRGNTLTAHLIHNNAFIIPPNGRGQAPSWHTDDALQQVILPKGKELPDYVKLPVLVATYMIWLSDCDTPDKGPTFVVPGSHRWGRPVNAEEAEAQKVPMCGKAGTAVLVNNQLWHRGAKNFSSVPRETLQLTFARRIIGHKFDTIMNYNLPEHVLKDRPTYVAERFGFLSGGAYS